MNERYWIDDIPLKKPFLTFTFAVVDEDAGGVIAYVSGYSTAKLLLDALIKESK